MTRTNIENSYFDWIYDIVCNRRFAKGTSYRMLLNQLYDTEFIYIIERDANRAEDGIDLRRRFDPYWNTDKPCSVLEMMVALSIRCEETIMDDPQIGDRTSQWFWGMITNLGLGSMHDTNYDEDYVYDTLMQFMNRTYSPDGDGGLFTVRNCDRDLRNVEIWIQMCWYLDTIV